MDISYDPCRDEDTDFMEDDDREEDPQVAENLQLPIVYPRRRYLGACNVETVKDGVC